MKEIKIDAKMQKEISDKIDAYLKKTRLRNTLLRLLTFIASAVAMYTFIQMAKQVNDTYFSIMIGISMIVVGSSLAKLTELNIAKQRHDDIEKILFEDGTLEEELKKKINESEEMNNGNN